MTPARTLVVATGDRLLLDAAGSWFARRAEWRVVGLALDGVGAMAMVARAAPDAVLLVEPVPRLSAPALAQQIYRRFTSTTVVVLGGHDVAHAHALPADAGTAEVVAALAAGPAEAADVWRGDRGGLRLLEALTRRERTVLRLLAEGSSMEEVARDLGVSDNTVRTHMQNLYAKLGCHTRVEVVHFAIEHGIAAAGDAGAADRRT